jgi:ribosomal protein L19
VIAFLAASLVAFITLLAAYITLSVTPQLFNAGDTVLPTQLRKCLRKLRTKLPRLKRVKVVDSQNESIDAFKAFMLSISDQILVSQVTILIAAFIIHVEITIYSVNIVIAPGCLASTVHLGSFPFYIDHLRDHGTAKMVRVIAMAARSGMLVFAFIIQLSYTWDMETHVYFTCVLHDFQIKGEDIAGRIIELFVPISVLYGTYEIFQLLYTKQPSRGKFRERSE